MKKPNRLNGKEYKDKIGEDLARVATVALVSIGVLIGVCLFLSGLILARILASI
jgi:hypothetical protein